MILVRFLDLKFLPKRAAIMIGTSNPPCYGGGMIRVTSSIAIDDDELDESFVRASGPGEQNVNKLSSAVQLRFDVRRSPNLPNDVRARLERLAGSRLTRDGVLIISAQRHRPQERNRQDARDRLIELIQRAAIAPIPRRATKPTAGSRQRRLDSKKRRSSIKGLRQAKPAPEEDRCHCGSRFSVPPRSACRRSRAPPRKWPTSTRANKSPSWWALRPAEAR